MLIIILIKILINVQENQCVEFDLKSFIKIMLVARLISE